MRLPQPFSGLAHSVQQPLKTTGGGLIIFYSAVAYSFNLRKRTVREVLAKQIYFTGVEPLFNVLVISLLVGYLFVLLLEEVHQVAGDASTRLLSQSVVMELSPLVCGMIVLTRSGAAITSEIASMKQRGEIRSLCLMGIDAESYLIAPRLFGVAIGTMLLSFYFTIGCSIGGLTVSVLLSKASFESFFDVLADSLKAMDLLYPPLKGAITGSGVAAIACYHGLRHRLSDRDAKGGDRHHDRGHVLRSDRKHAYDGGAPLTDDRIPRFRRSGVPVGRRGAPTGDGEPDPR